MEKFQTMQVLDRDGVITRGVVETEDEEGSDVAGSKYNELRYRITVLK